MLDTNAGRRKCTICKDEYTSVHKEVKPGVRIYVCSNCLEAAKHNFIWLCLGCGQVYLRPKKLVLERLEDEDLKIAYSLCEDMQIIQGIEVCVACDPEGIEEYMDIHKAAMC
jgi:hypothetical protein